MTLPQLRLHNTLTRAKEAFEPADPSRVRLYVCGPTVYQRIHVGNARPLVVFDVLFRFLKYLYPGKDRVTYVRNITDIDDKIIAQASANCEGIRDLTERTARQFREDAAALGCLPPTHEPRATEHVPGMVALIEELVGRGHAYAAEGHVLFHVPSMPAYGRLSGRDRADQIAGARVEVAPYKRDPADFVLWKPSDPDQPGWDSPWGRGRPGWHVECSAMSEALLGPLPFDIHGGGLDLIFPHHENEIAQSCCARGVERMARFWMHNGFVDMRGEKMSKSLGNIVRVEDALRQADQIVFRQGEILRMWLLSSHYRQPVTYSNESLDSAKRALKSFYVALHSAGNVDKEYERPAPEIVDVLLDDLNTPKAISILFRLLDNLTMNIFDQENQDWVPRNAGILKASANLLGLLQEDPEEWLQGIRRAPKPLGGKVKANVVLKAEFSLSREDIENLKAERDAARKAKNFARADAIRAELAEQGILLEDTPQGTTWRRA